jgi:hypothetical protein
MIPFITGFFVLTLVGYSTWYWLNRSWLVPLHREADGPCCMNAHIFVWIRHRRTT